MTFIYTIGETIYDIIFRNEQPVAARPGGSMLNSAVSLGRCGYKVEMITELGQDRIGNLVMDFLKQNGVSTAFVKPATGFKTPVSLAFLDDQGHAQYSFYKNYPDDRLNITWPRTKRGDVVLFGSFYSLDREIREKIISYVRQAKLDGGLIIYDPNIRKNHLGEIRKLMHLVEENLALADIVRGSDEDFENLFGLDDGDKVFEHVIQAGCHQLVITRGEQGADFYCADTRIHVPAETIKVASTIGAGDAFNAGLIYSIIKERITVDDLVNINQETWQKILEIGTTFAADVCGSYDNYISKELKIKN